MTASANLILARQSDLLHLVEAARSGGERERRRLVEECYPKLHDYSRSRGCGDAAGVADLVLAEFLARLPNLAFRSSKQVWSYLYHAARGRMVDERRREYRELPAERLGDPAKLVCRVGRSSEHESDVRLSLERLLDELTDEQSEVLRLRFLADLSISETAAKTGRSEAAVKAMQRRGLHAAYRAALALGLGLVVAGLVATASLRDERSLPVPPALDPDEPAETRAPLGPVADVAPSAGTVRVLAGGKETEDDQPVRRGAVESALRYGSPARTSGGRGGPAKVASARAHLALRPADPQLVVFCGSSHGTVAELTERGFSVTIGTAEADFIDVTEGDRPDLVVSFGGSDVILTGPGDDLICSGADDDLIYSGPGNDRIHAGHGDDTVEDREGENVIFGGEGIDYVNSRYER